MELRNLTKSLIENITVSHKKRRTGGVFTIDIRLNMFEEYIRLQTDWQAQKWRWVLPKIEEGDAATFDTTDIELKNSELLKFD